MSPSSSAPTLLSAELAELRAALRAEADPERAQQERRYLKSELEFIGVPKPRLRALARDLDRAHAQLDLLPLVAALWAQAEHELRTVGTVLLQRRARTLRPDALPLVEHILRTGRSWAYVDDVSIHVVRPILQNHPEASPILDRWATDSDFWMRRAALLTLLWPIRQDGGQVDRVLAFADPMLEEREFFIRKAIGWVLREIGQSQPERVVAWLEPRLDRLSGLTLREATRKLPAEQAAPLLARRRAR